MVRANGTVTAVDYQNGKVETALSASQLQDLLRFILIDQDFFSLNAANIRSAIAAEQQRTGQFIRVSDAGDTIVRIKTADMESEVSFNALTIYARRYPTIKPLQQLLAVQTRLSALIRDLTEGGKQTITVALEQANAYLTKQYPQPPVLATEDYVRTVLSADGRKLVEFLHDQGGGTATVSRCRIPTRRTTTNQLSDSKQSYRDRPEQTIANLAKLRSGAK